MKFTFVLLAAVATFLAIGAVAESVFDKELIDQINNDPTSTWKAGINENFLEHTLEEIKSMMGHIPSEGKVYPDVVSVDPSSSLSHQQAQDLPENYNSLETLDVKPLVKNQAKCGSCWAFSATSVLGYRISAALNMTKSISLAPEDPVSCDRWDFGCRGGRLKSVWKYMKDAGVVEEKCFPYTASEGTVAQCPKDECPGAGEWKKHYAKNSYHVSSILNKEKAIKTEIFNNGPTQAAFIVYQDFMSYQEGVYSHTTGSALGGHAVTITGWGVEDVNGKQVPYWLVQNSWGTEWGKLGGFFKIARKGVGSCGISANVYAGMPEM